MKTNMIKTTILGIFAIVAMTSSAFAGGKEISLKDQEVLLIEGIVKADIKELEMLASFEEESKVLIYDAEGNLVHESTLSNWNNAETKKLISKSDFLAEVGGNQYFLLDCK